MKKIVTGILAGAFILGMSIPAFAATFTDVPTSHWAYSSIENMAAKGVVNGVGQGKFAPADKILSTEFVTMVVRSYYADDVNLNDTELGWWEPYVNAADENELLSSIMLNETKPFTRTEMAQLIYNLIKNQNMTMPTSAEIENAKKQIPDISSVEEFYQTAVATVYQLGYLKGLDSTGRFGGNETMDRAQACAVMERLLNGVDKTEGDKSQKTDNVSYQNDKFEVWAYDKNNSDSRERMISFSVVETKAETYAKGIHIGTIAVREKETDDYNFGFFIDPSKYKFYSANEKLVTVDKFGEVYMQSCPEPMQTTTTYISVVSSEGTAKIDVKINNTFSEAEYGRKNIINEEYLTIYREEMLRLVNEAREENGVASLRYNSELELISDERANDITMNFSHKLPTGALSEELDNTYDLIDGENITRNTFGNGAVDTANIHFNSWMKSEGHRKNILDPDFKSFCCSVTSNQNAYAVQIFSFK